MQALIFDVDGVIAETEEGHRLAFNRAFAEAGLDIEWSPEMYERLLWVTGGKERIAHYLYHCPECPKLLDADIARLHRRKTELYNQIVQAGEVPFRPGVLRLWREARERGVRLAIATTTSLPNVEVLLRQAGQEVLGWFETIVAGDMVPQKKPAPDVYLQALKNLDIAPEEAVAIEDSQNGLIAAQKAGIPTLITYSYYTREQRFEGALAVLEHLGEPELPAKVVEGPRSCATVVTLDLLRGWHHLAAPRA
ncbi:HAD family hydrolase [Meiothermus hypogaeus]|uniref:Phosphatase n=2 Tax=Meiothermus hypogaeus TaxID=884155 RepID=A0A511QXA4_9DEIN|nr:HAD family hydrolase [Meiothermus hypogaeus]RIH79948.1 Phosphorylated carbohydrates phosphatase [Meiothermus hypogaeus]GEM82011.1 phosphatase [Meiothermus hypogaeus NBRC 106114]GIW35947.1 MAG: phosphatase [Meiothermus sp.]